MHYRYASLLACSVLAVHVTAQGNALDCDGVDDNVIVPAASALVANAQGITLACRIRPTNPAPAYPDFDGFVGFRNEVDFDFYLVQIAPSNTVEARFRNSAGVAFTATTTAVQLNSWQHVAITYDGSQFRIFRDGAQVTSVAANGAVTNAATDLYIGDVLYQFTHFYLDGQIDDVSLWSRALSADELGCLSAGDIADSTGLQLHYLMDQGVAGGNNAGITTLTDDMGQIDGNVSGFALNGSSSNFVASGTYGSTQDITICQGESILIDGQPVSAPGTYTGYVTNPLGCQVPSTVNLTVQPVDLAVTPLNVHLFAQATNATFQWLDCNNGFAEMAGATSYQYTATANGSYAVEVTQAGCTDTSACYDITTIGIEEVQRPIGSLGPVPALDELQVFLDRTAPRWVCTVLDPTGRMVMEREVEGARRTTIGITTLAPGSYVLRIAAGGENGTLRFVKE